jgi:hypothetical protein
MDCFACELEAREAGDIPRSVIAQSNLFWMFFKVDQDDESRISDLGLISLL